MTPLRVLPFSHQNGKSRYSNKDDETTPDIARYRNNLTALSQYNNLLFVAYVDKVHVFRPDLRHQELSKTPKFVIDLPKSRSGRRRGYLDSSSPHAVNHLVIGDLGNEEILVVVCDDGDVISYTIHSLILAIEVYYTKDTHPNSLKSDADPPILGNESSCRSELPTVKPWFLENVGRSAWGLAIHKEARLLAVSSNTQTIDVFAPALRQAGTEGEVVQDDSPHLVDANLYHGESWRVSTKLSPRDRTINVQIRLFGHTTNIPNITFANVDHEGRYLASTDINGNIFIWDIYNGTKIFHYLSTSSKSTRGWGVACLDPLFSRLTFGPKQTFGCDKYTIEKSTAINISDARYTIPDSSDLHPAYQKDDSVVGTSTVDLITMGLSQNMASDTESHEDDGEPSQGYVDFSDQLELEANLEAMIADGYQQEDPFDTLEQSPSEDDDDDEGSSEDLEFSSAYQPNNGNLALTSEVQPNDENLDVPIDLVFPSYEIEYRQEEFKDEPKKARTTGLLPFNLLQTTEQDVCLFRDIGENISNVPFTERAHTRILSRKTLHQRIPPHLHQLEHIERLNMIAQIPELGVVIIGNQAGRVGILTATRWEAARQWAYRFEYILPFRSEEEKGLRPQKPLMGMAVGPLQGHEYWPEPGSMCGIFQDDGATERQNQWTSRRFRLLMIYYDHTVLSYEISRQSEDDISVV